MYPQAKQEVQFLNTFLLGGGELEVGEVNLVVLAFQEKSAPPEKILDTRWLNTFEEVSVDDVVLSGGPDDLCKRVHVGRKTLPFVGDDPRITVASPVETVFVHPIVWAAEEIRVEDVDGWTGGCWCWCRRSAPPQPVERHVKRALSNTQSTGEQSTIKNAT